MSWGEPQQPNQQPSNPEQQPGGPWGSPVGPEGTQPYNVPQQPDYSAPANPYAQQQPYAGGPADPYQAGQQGFGAPPFGAQPDQFGGFQPPPPPKKGKGLVIGLVVGAVVVVGGIGTALALHKSPSTTPVAAQTSTTAPVATTDAPTTAAPTPTETDAPDSDVALPQTAGGLVLLDSPVAQQAVAKVKSNLSSAGGSESEAYQNALIGAYGPSANANPNTIVVIQPFTNLSSTIQLAFESDSASDLDSTIMSSAGATGVQSVQSTDPDAAVNCGNLASDGSTILACSWVDEDTFGITYFLQSTAVATAGKESDALRTGADGD